jgi:hypothetical protein
VDVFDDTRSMITELQGLLGVAELGPVSGHDSAMP